jgi:hypothetical protein
MYVFSETFGGVLVNTKNEQGDLKGGSAATDQEIVPLGLIFSKTNKKPYLSISDAATSTISDKKMNTFYKKIAHKKMRRHTTK